MTAVSIDTSKLSRNGVSPGWLGAIGLAALVILLEIIPRVGIVSPQFLPPFSQIMTALAEQVVVPEFWTALLSTLTGWSIGLGIAAIAGVLAGLLVGGISSLTAITHSTVEFLRPIPSVALIPLAILLYGSDMRATLILVIYASFWQIFVQVLYGVRDVDPVARETAQSYRFRRLSKVRYVIWPTTLPYVATGFRLAAAVALILEVTGELVIGSPGLGKEIALAQGSGAVAPVYALVVVTGLLGLIVNIGARILERRILHWHPSILRETLR